MRMDLKRPCKNCPFRKDVVPFLRPARVRQILTDITVHDQSFVCHNTIDYEEDEPVIDQQSQHCAGASIFLMQTGQPNQAMRIASRFGLFNADALDMETVPVFENAGDMLRHYRKKQP